MKILHALLVVPFLFSCANTPPPMKTAAFSVVKKRKVSNHAARGTSKSSSDTYQCMVGQEMIHLHSSVDRSGTTVPDFKHSSRTLEWQAAPQGMRYHEEVLGAWHGRQILVSTYQTTESAPDTSLPGWEQICYVLSCEDRDKVPRPFLVFTSDKTSVREFEYQTDKSPKGEVTGLAANWTLKGTGVFTTHLNFAFGEQGAYLTMESESGRHVPQITRDYNSRGKVIKTYKEPNL